ncbi:hypothetical protein K7432_006627 [Basidiobolus ranarum]|uniref:Uncharacterized protein n=1 Tax=Basidiobolus ranarum TaxID=34480 RepID=A0ABR2W1I1_9FUNG
MKFFSVSFVVACFFTCILSAPYPFDLGTALGTLTNAKPQSARPISSIEKCDIIKANLKIMELVTVDTIFCLDSHIPVQPEILKLESQNSQDCMVLKDSIAVKLDALGQLRVRAFVCLPQVALFVSL